MQRKGEGAGKSWLRIEMEEEETEREGEMEGLVQEECRERGEGGKWEVDMRGKLVEDEGKEVNLRVERRETDGVERVGIKVEEGKGRAGETEGEGGGSEKDKDYREGKGKEGEERVEEGRGGKGRVAV